MLGWQLSFNSKGWTLGELCPWTQFTSGSDVPGCAAIQTVSKILVKFHFFIPAPFILPPCYPLNKCSPTPFENNLPPQKYCALAMYIQYMSHIFLKAYVTLEKNGTQENRQFYGSVFMAFQMAREVLW